MVIYGANTTLYANVLGSCPLPVTVSDHQYDFTFLGSEIPTKTFFYLPVGKQMNLTKLSGALPMFSQGKISKVSTWMQNQVCKIVGREEQKSVGINCNVSIMGKFHREFIAEDFSPNCGFRKGNPPEVVLIIQLQAFGPPKYTNNTFSGGIWISRELMGYPKCLGIIDGTGTVICPRFIHCIFIYTYVIYVLYSQYI